MQPLLGHAISIKPLLRVLREKQQGISVLNHNISETAVVRLTAYADDVIVIIRSQEDIFQLSKCLDWFQKAPSAKVNWNKTEALLCGQWKEEAPPHLPQQCHWNTEGLKILGICFGTQQYMTRNWDGVVEKILGRLKRWNWIQPQLSCRGRVLVINNLAASMLWHRLTVLDPPAGLLQLLQKHFVNFFWGGHHWVHSGILSLPVFEGGQGLIDLTAKWKAMRLQSAQKLLYDIDPQPWIMYGLAVLRAVSKIGLDRQLFLISNNAIKGFGIKGFYQSVLRAWSMFKMEREDHFGLEEPLFHNPWLCHPSNLPSTEINTFISSGVSKVADLVDTEHSTWLCAQEITKQMGRKSERIVQNVLSKLKSSFPTSFNKFLENFFVDGLNQSSFPELFVTPYNWQDNGQMRQLLSFKELLHVSFSDSSKQLLYTACVKSRFCEQLKNKTDTKWRSYLSAPDVQLPSWRLFYKSPLPKRSGDLQWRILHCALATKTFLFKCNLSTSSVCKFCNVSDTVFHIFFDCYKILPLLNILENIFEGFGWNFSKTVFIFGSKYIKSQSESCTFSNFLIGQAKLTIWKAYKLENEDKRINMVELFKALVESRVKIEYEFYKMNNDMHIFKRKWCINVNFIFVNDDDKLVFQW